jgi:Tfp pilus assembly protein PilO
LKNYQDSISKIDFALPEDPKIFSLFNFLQKISSQSGLLVEEIGSISSEQKGDLKKWTGTFHFKGDYLSFKNFISSLEKSSRLIKVEKITMKSGEKGLSFSITISVFSF